MATAIDWLALFGHCLLLSLLTIGGVYAVVPDLHRVLVLQMGLLDDAQFNASIALAQSAPGPNILLVAVMGYQAAGVMGTLATLVGIMLPSTLLALAVTRFGHARRHWRAVRAFKAGMAPIVIALTLAAAWILATETPGRSHLVVSAAAALLVWRTRVHLLVLIAAGAAIGALGWI